MNSYQLVHNIKESQELFASFNALAEATFEINFTKWRDLDYWNEKYIPYAFVEKQEVIANASVTRSELVIDKKIYQVIQIRTVMTKKEYQKQGLARQLIEKIVADYQERVDFIYLFANETVLDFYPKFGFKRKDEWLFEISPNQIAEKNVGISVVNFDDHQEKIERKAIQRNNSHLSTFLTDIEQLTMFYYSTAFENMISYIEPIDTYVCYEIEGVELHLFDILSEKNISIKEMLTYLPLENIKIIYCHFQLEEQEELVVLSDLVPINDDALFILGNQKNVIEDIKFPLISHA